MKKVDLLINALPLKEMEASLLQRAIVSFADSEDLIDTNKIREAIHIAAYLHRNDYRQGRLGKSEDHYITHPLRNTLRLIRYGCKDQDILLASILHDTVEDHAFNITEEFVEINVNSEEEARETAYSYLDARFGGRVAEYVKAVSNPLHEGHKTKEEKRALYVEHVLEVVKILPVFMVKFTDYVDNAVGLYHNVSPHNTKMINHLALKYLPLASVFETKLEDEGHLLPVSPEGLMTMKEQIKFGKEKLTELVALS